MMIKRLICALALAGASASSAAGTADRAEFRPKDECLHVTGYFELRSRLENIVRQRDAKALTAMLSAEIGFEMGETNAKDRFVHEWKLTTGKASPIWPHLDKILRLGCFAQSDRDVSMPHMYGLEPHWDSDRITPKALVLGDYINLRASPSIGSVSKGMLSWEFVAISDEVIGDGWIPVKTRDGKSGYVLSQYLRSYWDYRIGFSRQGQVWTINHMMAGD